MVVLVLQGPVLCIDLLVQHSLCMKWEFAWSEPAFKWTKNILKQSNSRLKSTFSVTCIKSAAEYMDKKKCEACRASSKCNDFLSDFFLSYSSICRHLKLHRNKCRIKIVGKDFKCSMKYSSDWFVTLFQHQSISIRTTFEQFVNEGRSGFKSFSLHIYNDHQGAVMRDAGLNEWDKHIDTHRFVEKVINNLGVIYSIFISHMWLREPKNIPGAGQGQEFHQITSLCC